MSIFSLLSIRADTRRQLAVNSRTSQIGCNNCCSFGHAIFLLLCFYQLAASPIQLTFLLTDTFLLLFISMIIIAASLYLPGHITTMISRAWFYWAGDETVGRNAGVDIGAGAGTGAMSSRPKPVPVPGGRMDGQDVIDMLGTL